MCVLSARTHTLHPHCGRNTAVGKTQTWVQGRWGRDSGFFPDACPEHQTPGNSLHMVFQLGLLVLIKQLHLWLGRGLPKD